MINNKNRTDDNGVWTSGASHNLQKRGEPRWIIHGIGLLAAGLLIHNLRKAYTMPKPMTKTGGDKGAPA